MYRLLIISTLFSVGVWGSQCTLPSSVAQIAKAQTINSLSSISDVRRNRNALKGLCLYTVNFKENGRPWRMLLVRNPSHPRGPVWFLPHDNENSAFSSAVYAVRRYGGAFLAVVNHDRRYNRGQDPNRNFSMNNRQRQSCSREKYPSPIYTQTVFGIIDSLKASGAPYLALHNNSNGHNGNGGSGSISILRSSSSTRSYPASPICRARRCGLSDEDSIVYIAGRSSSAPSRKLNALRRMGMHTKYEIITPSNNDCSMSNYTILYKGSNNYYNIETEHGDTATQKAMIDRLMAIVGF